jgi:hypothetical protein
MPDAHKEFFQGLSHALVFYCVQQFGESALRSKLTQMARISSKPCLLPGGCVRGRGRQALVMKSPERRPKVVSDWISLPMSLKAPF